MMETVREEIEEAFRRAGLRKTLGKGWTPMEMAIRAWREQLKGGYEDEREDK